MGYSVMWGSKKSAVRESQPGKADNSIDDTLGYSRELSGYIFDVTYFFDEKRLELITYSYTDVPDDDAEAIEVWGILMAKFEADFGKPIKKFERDRKSIDENDLAYWSSLGHAIDFRWAVFEDDSTRAVVKLDGTPRYLLSVEAQLTPKP